MCKRVVVANFKALFQNLPGETDENCKRTLVIIADDPADIRTHYLQNTNLEHITTPMHSAKRLNEDSVVRVITIRNSQ
jgi:hypothetical protein